MSDYLPEPIVEKILLRLPIKCLMKCTAVCKSWMSLIKSSTFIHTHLSRTIQDKNARLFLLNAFSKFEYISKSYSLLWDDPVFGECKLIDPITYNGGTIVYKGRNVSLQSLFVVGTCNGLVCLAPLPLYGVDSPVLIWNPSVRKVVILPSPPPTKNIIYKVFSFGYDSDTNDYKVLMILSILDESTEMIETRGNVYSLARGTWAARNSVELVSDQFFYAHAIVNVNGSPHWYGDELCGRLYGMFSYILMSFDMVSEVFRKIEVPEALRQQTGWCTKYGDCLALATKKTSFELDIWVMKEYGVAESWTKLTLRHGGDLKVLNLIYARSEELVFENYFQNLSIVDCRTDQKREFRIGGPCYFFLDSFVESILLLGHANAISY